MSLEKVDYASILFNGGCNLDCPDCIGKAPEFQNMAGNLNVYPLRNLDHFLQQVMDRNVRYLSISGIHADPQLYAHEQQLLQDLRVANADLVLSVHTNGLAAAEKMDVFNMYDKATISLPSYDPETFAKVTGSDKMPDLEKIMAAAKIPVKLSFLLTSHNQNEFMDYVARSSDLGVKRIIVRKLYGKEDELPLLNDIIPASKIYNCPVYLIDGVEVTVWNHSEKTVQGLYLFPNGEIKRNFMYE